MNTFLVLATLFFFARPTFAAKSVMCTDEDASTEVSIQFASPDTKSAPSGVTLKSDGKSTSLDNKSITRFVRNEKDFYLLFKVKTKTGLHDVELNTRFAKSTRGQLVSHGVLVNKSAPGDRLKVTCLF